MRNSVSSESVQSTRIFSVAFNHQCSNKNLLKEYLFLRESGLERRRLVKIPCFFHSSGLWGEMRSWLKCVNSVAGKDLRGWQNNPVSIQVKKTYPQAEYKKQMLVVIFISWFIRTWWNDVYTESILKNSYVFLLSLGKRVCCSSRKLCLVDCMG